MIRGEKGEKSIGLTDCGYDFIQSKEQKLENIQKQHASIGCVLEDHSVCVCVCVCVYVSVCRDLGL